MDSNAASTAQAYFDTGNGYNPGETATAPIAAGSTPQTLAFPLPPLPVVGIRFDPLMVPGTVHLHSAVVRRGDNHEEVGSFDLRQITGVHEIARVTPQADGLEVVTTPDSNDSQVGLLVREPIVIAPTPVYDQIVHWVGIDVSITTVTLVVLGLLWWSLPRLARFVRPLTARIVALDRRFASWAEALGRPEVASLDHWIFWFYGGCALVFGVMAAAGLHGSSLDEYASQYAWSGVNIGSARRPRGSHPQRRMGDPDAGLSQPGLPTAWAQPDYHLGRRPGRRPAHQPALPGFYPGVPARLLGLPLPAARAGVRRVLAVQGLHPAHRGVQPAAAAHPRPQRTVGAGRAVDVLLGAHAMVVLLDLPAARDAGLLRLDDLPGALPVRGPKPLPPGRGGGRMRAQRAELRAVLLSAPPDSARALRSAAGRGLDMDPPRGHLPA